MSRHNEVEDYHSIFSERIKSLQNEFNSLKKRKPEYCFTCLSIQNIFFKNSPDDFDSNFIKNSVVDGKGDGGVDAIFTDPDSDYGDMVLVQAKYYKKISLEQVKNAIHKMVDFVNDMEERHHKRINTSVKSRFARVSTEMQDSAKFVLVFVTNAPRGKIKNESCTRLIAKYKDKFDLRLYFDKELCDEIREKEGRRQSATNSVIEIDQAENCLTYGEARIVNVSALSIKDLYSEYGTNLLASNLRYYIKGRIDNDINKTINERPKEFWYRNNGLTIVCESYKFNGKEVQLKNFSIVNGGQTTKLLSASEIKKDFYIPCKIIKAIGKTKKEKENFLSEVAKATNSQKPIKPIDLKANAPEQLNFRKPLEKTGVYYLTKRGETPPTGFKDSGKHINLDQIAKLCLAGVFQFPARARNNASKFFDDDYYDLIFRVKDLNQIARVVQQLLKIQLYFEKHFIAKYEDKCQKEGTEDLIPFARNAKTLCIAFASLAARIINGEIPIRRVPNACAHFSQDNYDKNFKPLVANTNARYSLFSEKLVRNEKEFENVLWILFDAIITEGYGLFESEQKTDNSLNETNYLKKDQSYYEILSSTSHWKKLVDAIHEVKSSLSQKGLI